MDPVALLQVTVRLCLQICTHRRTRATRSLRFSCTPITRRYIIPVAAFRPSLSLMPSWFLHSFSFEHPFAQKSPMPLLFQFSRSLPSPFVSCSAFNLISLSFISNLHNSNNLSKISVVSSPSNCVQNHLLSSHISQFPASTSLILKIFN